MAKTDLGINVRIKMICPPVICEKCNSGLEGKVKLGGDGSLEEIKISPCPNCLSTEYDKGVRERENG